MKVKDAFARLGGGLAGAGLALAVPHVGCLAALTPVFVGMGAGAGLATGATYLAGAAAVAGGGAAVLYGLRPSREVCCLTWGETRRVRLKKGLAIGAFALVAVAAVNTLADTGPDIETRALFLDAAHRNGYSVWEQQRSLDTICAQSGRWWWNPFQAGPR